MKWIGKHPVFSDLMIGSVLLTPPDNQYEYELTLPNDDGTSGQVLTTDGNGVLTWTTPSSGTPITLNGTTVNGIATYASANTLDIESTLTYTSTVLTLSGTSAANLPAIMLKNDHAGSDGANIQFNKLQDGSDDDELGIISWFGDDEAGNQLQFASITGRIADATDTDEGGKLELKVLTNSNEYQQALIATGIGTASRVDVGIAYGAASTTAIAGEVTLGVDLAIAHGGTGASTAQAAIDALTQVSGATTGHVLTKDGSGNATYQAQTDTTYTAGDGLDLSGTEFSTDLKSNGGLVIESTELAVDLGASSITGTLAVADGGTGATTFNSNSLLTGNGTSAIEAESDLTFNGSNLFIGSSSDSLTDKIYRSPAGSNIAGGNLEVHGGYARAGAGTNQAGGNLDLFGGLSTGTGASGKINFNTGWEGVSGTGQLGPALHTEIASTATLNTLTIYEPNLGANDYFKTSVEAAGATTLATLDASGGQGATLNLDADGLMILDADRNGSIQFKDDGVLYGHLTSASSLSNFTLFEAAGASNADYFKIDVDTHGATTIATHDTAGHQADLTLDVDGTITIDSTDGIIDFDDDTDSMARIQSELGNALTIYGNADGPGKIVLTEDTDNGVNSITVKASAAIASNRTAVFQDADGTIAYTTDIQKGWHGSTTRIKILPRDFVANDVGRPLMIEDDSVGSNELFLFSHSASDMFAYVPIPTGYQATHVRIYGSDTSQNFYVYEGNIDSKTIVDIATGTTAIGTEKALATQLTSDTTNYILVRVTSDGSTDEIYGGYVTIAEV